MGAMNSIRSMAIVATGPLERSRAIMPPALSIWLRTQPPKMWPLALMSAGPGIRRRIGSRRTSVMRGLFSGLGQLDEGPSSHATRLRAMGLNPTSPNVCFGWKAEMSRANLAGMQSSFFVVVLLALGAAGPARQPDVRVTGDGVTCTLTVNAQEVSSRTQLRATIGSAKSIVLKTDDRTPKGCII